MICQKESIKDLNDLRNHLQFAIGLELATIPIYLTGLYSIVEGQNTVATRIIQTVAIEEMLHMALAANVLNAIGGKPGIEPICGQDPIIRQFPGKLFFLPDLGNLHLRRFSQESVKTFIKIEEPHSPCEAPDQGYASIGEFYKAIICGIKKFATEDVFCEAREKRRNCQITSTEYYGGAGRLFSVTDQASALKAIDEIIAQGEGVDECILKDNASQHVCASENEVSPPLLDGDILADGWQMRTHYARFREIQHSRRYKADQQIGQAPKGAVIPIDWKEVYPMADNPRASDYEGTEVHSAIYAFNQTYTDLLNNLYSAFNGKERHKQEIRNAVTIMWRLKNQAIALMKTPSPIYPGKTVGTPFEYLGKNTV